MNGTSTPDSVWRAHLRVGTGRGWDQVAKREKGGGARRIIKVVHPVCNYSSMGPPIRKCPIRT